MDSLRATSIPSMRLSHRHGSSSSPSSPLYNPTQGSLHLTTHHLIFERDIDADEHPGEAARKEGEGSGTGGGNDDNELWIPLPLLHSVTRSPPTLTGAPSPLLLRTRTYSTISLHFTSASDADAVWDSLKGLCGRFSEGGLEERYAFFCKHAGAGGEGGMNVEGKGKGRAGWEIYNPEEEFARMGVGSRSKAWRFTTINADFQFCPSYPAQIVVPAKISDTTLSYAVKYRSKSRIPGLVYLHWANLGSITRSSQPMVGITQNARSIQDEKLIESIFMTHSQHSHALQPMGVSDRPVSPSNFDSSNGGQVYGATATNIIIDARPTKNAYANSVKGAGTENMTYYKNCRKEYLGIDNIHVMRSSLTGIFDALIDAETTGRLDRVALRRTGWLSHLTNILDGVLIIVRTVHLNNSHALVHCSDGWDRTSQLSALPQLCLDPFFRTTRGLAVLIEKDWISYGHRFADRSGHLCNDRVDFVQKLGDDASTQQAFLATVTRQFAPSSHAFKETCPVFQQFLDCIYQIQRQYPERFEWNETLLRFLVRETYVGGSGSFLFNSERERAELGARERTSSVWESVFDQSPSDDGSLSLKPEFRNAAYDPSLNDPHSKRPDADQGVLLFNPQDVKWWYELFGRSDEEMNPVVVPIEEVPAEPTVTEHQVVQGGEDDPVLHPISAKTAELFLTSPPSSSSPLPPPSSPSASSRLHTPLPRHPSSSLSRTPSPSSHPSLPQPPPQLQETVASVQKLGWSAFKAVQKFGQDAAKQYKEAQEKNARDATVDEQGQGYGHGQEGSSGSWRAMGGSEGASELSDGGHGGGGGGGAGWGSSAGSIGKSAGGLWGRLAANPWGGEASSSASSPSQSSFTSPPPPSASSTPSYQPYQPRSASSRPQPDSSSSYSSSPLHSSPHPSSSTRPPLGSTLSINPWEAISREEALPTPAASTSSSRPPAFSSISTSSSSRVPVEAEKTKEEARNSDPLGVGLA